MKPRFRWLVLTIALLGAFYCYSGVIMVGSFSVAAPPELLPQYRLRANQWLAGSVAFLAVGVWQGVALWRNRPRTDLDG